MVEPQGDLYGKHTCITYNACSVVDYTIVSQELLNCISIFQVDKFTALSSHCPIVCSLCAHCNYSMIFVASQSWIHYQANLSGQTKLLKNIQRIYKVLNLVKVLKSS